MAAGGDGALALVEGSIVGFQPGDPHRLLASFFSGVPSPGAPVANESGELTGMVAGQPAVELGLGLLRFRSDTAGIPILALRNLQIGQAPEPMPLSELVRRGVLLRPLERDQHVLSAGFAPGVRRQGAATQPLDQRFEFSASEKTMFVFVTWTPQERLKTTAAVIVYDSENRVFLRSAPLKLDLRLGRTLWTDWKIAVPGAPGVYRVDVLLADAPAWRGYFRVSQ
jgi:hypothetical protein